MGFPHSFVKWKPKLLRSSPSSNSVHPSSDSSDPHLRSRAKVLERLGPVTQRDYFEIDELLNKSRPDSHSPLDDDDDDSDYDSLVEDDYDSPDALPDQQISSPLRTPDHPPEIAAANIAQVPLPLLPLSPFLGPRNNDDRRCDSDICVRDLPKSLAFEQSRSSVDSVKQRCALASTSDRVVEVSTGRRRNKTEKLHFVAAGMLIAQTKHGGCCGGRHPCEISRENNPANDAGNVFPLPLPMYHLPTPGISMAKNPKSTAHPLPQPPSPTRPSVRRHSLSPKFRCDARIKERTTDKHVPGRLQTIAFDTSDKLMQKTIQPDLAYTNLQQETSLPSSVPTRSVSPTSQRFILSSVAQSSCPSPLSPNPIAPQSPRPPLRKVPRKWQRGKILGNGSFGTVYEGLNLEDGSFFAVKVGSKEDKSPEIQQEVDVLSKLEHPNIVSYYGSSIEDGRLCIFLELVRMGSLDTNLKTFKRFEEETIRRYTRQILLGLNYLHAKNTIHRDIKCSNILVDVNGQVKLSDFGIAKQIDNCLIYSVKGTPLYMAPEVMMANKSSYSFPADIWSLGCTVFEMANGKPPWSHLDGFAFMFKATTGELPPMPKGLSPDGKNFICSCLKFNPNDRPTAAELLQHPFIANAPATMPEHFIPRPLSSSPLQYGQSESSKTTWICGNHHVGTSGY